MATTMRRALYHQIVDDLRSQIASGKLPVEAAIPSTNDLAERYDVSITVVRKAVEVLRNEGLVEGQPGKGVFVAATPEAIESDRVTLQDLTRQVAELRAEVTEIRGTVEQLYNRLGHPYPNDNAGSAKPSRKTGT
ncbi:winged helix-turn-helix domain-containing protein [Nonomuraea sp. NPDC004297]